MSSRRREPSVGELLFGSGLMNDRLLGFHPTLTRPGSLPSLLFNIGTVTNKYVRPYEPPKDHIHENKVKIRKLAKQRREAEEAQSQTQVRLTFAHVDTSSHIRNSFLPLLLCSLFFVGGVVVFLVCVHGNVFFFSSSQHLYGLRPV